MSDAEERILKSISEAGALFADQISPDRDTTDRLQALLKSGLVEYCYTSAMTAAGWGTASR